MAAKLDPVTLEVIRNEMAADLQRTSYNIATAVTARLLYEKGKKGGALDASILSYLMRPVSEVS